MASARSGVSPREQLGWCLPASPDPPKRGINLGPRSFSVGQEASGCFHASEVARGAARDVDTAVGRAEIAAPQEDLQAFLVARREAREAAGALVGGTRNVRGLGRHGQYSSTRDDTTGRAIMMGEQLGAWTG